MLWLGRVRHRLGKFFIQCLANIPCAIILGGISFSAQATSFNCAKARPGVEQAICLDSVLSQLDEKMKAAYDVALTNASNVETTRQVQRDWLRFSRNSCTTVECLRQVYEQRIDALTSGSPEILKLVGGMGRLYGALSSAPYGLSYGPSSAALKPYAAWLQALHFLEAISESFASISPMPSTLRITTQECGEPNAVYFASKNSVVLCYELVRELASVHNKRVTEPNGDQSVESRRLIQGLRFTVFHELGHAIFKWNEKDGLLGREETAADSVATVLLLKGMREMPELNDALWGVWTEFQLFKNLSVQHPSDEHENSEQRLYNFSCLLGGRAPTFVPNLIKANLLTSHRSQRCAQEWNAALLGVQRIAQRSVAVR